MRLLLIILVFCNVAWSKTLDEIKSDYWKQFKFDFSKSYESSESENLRKEIFWQNLKTITYHNYNFRRGRSTFKMGINKFTDLTFTEYSNMFKANETTKNRGIEFMKNHHFEPEMIYYGFREKKNVNSSAEKSLPDIPTSFDWREKGAVTAVKDQKLCGACYAMSALASVESQIFIKTGKLIQLSEQEIVDCSNDIGTFRCEGGISFKVYDYIKENGGISSTQDYPYEAEAGRCRKNEKNKVEIDIRGYGFVDDKDDQLLMEAVVKLGPIMISIDTDHESFMHYASGIYFEDKCTEEVNHGALLIGYGSENGQDFWIVKNSFGAKWGDSGYVKVAKGRGNDCSVNLVPLFPVLNDKNGQEKQQEEEKEVQSYEYLQDLDYEEDQD